MIFFRCLLFRATVMSILPTTFRVITLHQNNHYDWISRVMSLWNLFIILFQMFHNKSSHPLMSLSFKFSYLTVSFKTLIDIGFVNCQYPTRIYKSTTDILRATVGYSSQTCKRHFLCNYLPLPLSLSILTRSSLNSNIMLWGVCQEGAKCSNC